MLRLLIFIITTSIAILFGIGNTSFVTTGTIPLWHLNEKYGFDVSEIPNLSGKIAVVTGASSGLGLATASLLAKNGASVVATARSTEKCQATIEAVGYASRCIVLELMSLRKTISGAHEILTLVPRIDYLILNAGIMAPPELLLSEDSIEAQFATNHLGHFLLTRELLPLLNKDSRIVAVSSVAHWFTKPMLDLQSLNDASNYKPFIWYGWTKLCNLLFVNEFARKYGIIAHAVHPGGVQGKLLRFAALPTPLVQIWESLFYWKADTAALTVIRPLVDDAFSNAKSPLYLVPIARVRRPSIDAMNSTLAAELWTFSDALLAEHNI